MLDRTPSEARKRQLRRARDRRRDVEEQLRRRRESKARYRRRQASGKVCLHIEVPEHDLAEAFMRSGRLTPKQALSRTENEGALARLVAQFIDRWGRVPCNPPGLRSK
jgi:hypothetical protein